MDGCLACPALQNSSASQKQKQAKWHIESRQLKFTLGWTGMVVVVTLVVGVVVAVVGFCEILPEGVSGSGGDRLGVFLPEGVSGSGGDRLGVILPEGVSGSGGNRLGVFLPEGISGSGGN